PTGTVWTNFHSIGAHQPPKWQQTLKEIELGRRPKAGPPVSLPGVGQPIPHIPGRPPTAGPLDPVHRQWTGWSTPTSSLDVAHDLFVMASNPIKTGTELYQVDKIDAMQQQFRTDYAKQLADLRQSLVRVQQALERLSQVVQQGRAATDAQPAQNVL